jgi:hypothetical protein
MDFEKPNTKHLVLKPKEIEKTDKLAREGDGTAISVQLMHQQNRVGDLKAAERRRTGDPFPTASGAPEPALSAAFKPKEIALTDLPSHPGDEEAIKVHEILYENRIAEELSGWARIKRWTKRKSRRDRDFLLAVGTVDLGFVLIMVYMPSQVTLVYGLSGITLFTTMVAWIMYMVMDDY